MNIDELARLHNGVRPRKNWVSSSWHDSPGVWTEEGPFVGKHICDIDKEYADLIAAMRNHFDEFINLIKVVKNYRADAMYYTKSAIRMVKREIDRDVYNKAYSAMQNSDEILENALQRIEEVR